MDQSDDEDYDGMPYFAWAVDHSVQEALDPEYDRYLAPSYVFCGGIEDAQRAVVVSESVDQVGDDNEVTQSVRPAGDNNQHGNGQGRLGGNDNQHGDIDKHGKGNYGITYDKCRESDHNHGRDGDKDGSDDHLDDAYRQDPKTSACSEKDHSDHATVIGKRQHDDQGNSDPNVVKENESVGDDNDNEGFQTQPNAGPSHPQAWQQSALEKKPRLSPLTTARVVGPLRQKYEKLLAMRAISQSDGSETYFAKPKAQPYNSKVKVFCLFKDCRFKRPARDRTRHMLSKHFKNQNEQVWECPNCASTLSRDDALKRHCDAREDCWSSVERDEHGGILCHLYVVGDPPWFKKQELEKLREPLPRHRDHDPLHEELAELRQKLGVTPWAG